MNDIIWGGDWQTDNSYRYATKIMNYRSVGTNTSKFVLLITNLEL